MADPNNDLVIFDLDGTLITPYMENPGKEYHIWSLLPGRREKLQALYNAGVRIAIVTNQAGVAFGHISEYDVFSKIAKVMLRLGFSGQFWQLYDHALGVGMHFGMRCNSNIIPIHVCYSHPNASERGYVAGHERRKPAPAMLLEALSLHDTMPEHAVFVGDRPEDSEAARAAGISYVWAPDYFSTAAADQPAGSLLRSLDDLYRES
jgi:D-glycero-D-manno-heptose 1,7-bisphosphate phosphatase